MCPEWDGRPLVGLYPLRLLTHYCAHSLTSHKPQISEMLELVHLTPFLASEVDRENKDWEEQAFPLMSINWFPISYIIQNSTPTDRFIVSLFINKETEISEGNGPSKKTYKKK